MGMVKLALGDLIITFLWVLSVSTLGAGTSVIASYLDVDGAWNLVITTSLLVVLVFVFSALGDAMGGASWNPTALSTGYALGASADSLVTMAIRFPAQGRVFCST